jgi:RNA polymerase sigma-70 factor, ECF subfamily
MTVPWRLAVGEVDGEAAIILLHRGTDEWAPHSLVHLEVVDDRITRIADYWHTPWILQAATSLVVQAAPPNSSLLHVSPAAREP